MKSFSYLLITTISNETYSSAYHHVICTHTSDKCRQ